MADQKRNPKNNESPLFRGLTRLFSGPLVDFRTQAQLKFRRRDLDKFKWTSASGQTFKKKSYNPYDVIQSNIMVNQTRAERYTDFDQMEYYPELASGLDIYADEMTTSNKFRQLLHIDCPNEEIRQILHGLFYETLNIKSNLFGWCRTLCKYGDLFLYIDVDEDVGIKAVRGLPTQEIERLEGQDKTNPNYVQFQWNSGGITFESWQIAHFRINGQDKYSPYGTSVLEPARRIWRQLQLMEDAMMAYRVVRAPERRVFYIDTGNIAPQDVEQYMQKVMTQMKRNQIVDPTTGRIDLRYNPMSVEEDYYIPIRGAGSGTKIDSLKGGDFTGVIDDIKYLRDKLFSAIKIPQSYLSRGDQGSDDKATLAQKDIRFARTIQRLQRTMVSELQKIAYVHLYTLGFRNKDLISFELALNNPSKIADLQEIEHLKAQIEVANGSKEAGFSSRWAYENIFHMSDEEIVRIQRERFYDKYLEKQLEEAMVGEESSMGSDLDLGMDTEGASGGESPAAAAEQPASQTTEKVPLLAQPETGAGETPETAPARRPDGSYDSGKGKFYKPVEYNKSSAGARQRSNAAKWSAETASNTKRNVFKGKSVLDTLSAGIAEHEDREDRRQEEYLLKETQQLLETLDAKFGNRGDK
jgi:hypothetical protein